MKTRYEILFLLPCRRKLQRAEPGVCEGSGPFEKGFLVRRNIYPFFDQVDNHARLDVFVEIHRTDKSFAIKDELLELPALVIRLFDHLVALVAGQRHAYRKGLVALEIG